jgi:hypothetical protein
MASFAGKTGLSINEHCAIDPFPKVTIKASGGFKDNRYTQAARIEWQRNNSFNKATIILNDRRAGYGGKLDVDDPIKVGALVEIKILTSSGTETFFEGRVMNISHRWADPDNEEVTLSLVGKRYDFFRHTIFGQLGYMASGETGEEVTSGPFGGHGWFNALPCIFNPRDFVKEVEGITTGLTAETVGNARKSITGVVAGIGMPKVFECDPYATGEGRAEKWTAYEMVQYVLGFMALDPVAQAMPIKLVTGDGSGGSGSGGGGSTDLPSIGLDFPFALGDPRGLSSETPNNVSIDGLNCMEAITKICSSAGYDWWVNPTNATIEFWPKGKGFEKRKFYFKDLSPDGVVNDDVVPASPADLRASKVSWNVISGEITFNHLAIADTYVSTTERCRVQNYFIMRKLWSDEVNKTITDVLEKADQPDSSGKEVVVKPKTFRTISEIRASRGGGVLNLRVYRANPHISKKGTLEDWGRRWGFDEVGRLKDETGDDRLAYGFHGRGLVSLEELADIDVDSGGSTYCFGNPRPILPRNVEKNEDGDNIAPKIVFGKFLPAQDAVKKEDNVKGQNLKLDQIQHKHEGHSDIAGAEGNNEDGGDGETRHPWGSKTGSVRILKNVGGLQLTGGVLEASTMTWDEKLDRLVLFPPAVLGTIQHDQGLPVGRRKIFLGGFPFARRKIDGSRFKCRKVFANDKRSLEKLASDTGITKSDAALVKAIIDERQDTDLARLLERHIDDIASLRAAGRISVPTITAEYVLGQQIHEIADRLDFIAVIPSIAFDLTTNTTEITLESEAYRVISNVPIPVGTDGTRSLRESTRKGTAKTRKAITSSVQNSRNITRTKSP